MALPFVSRALYESQCEQTAAVQALYADLLDRYHALKLQGAVVQRPAVAKGPPMSPEDRLMAEADAEYEQNAVAVLIQQGTPDVEARMIAKQMRASLNLNVPFDG